MFLENVMSNVLLAVPQIAFHLMSVFLTLSSFSYMLHSQLTDNECHCSGDSYFEGDSYFSYIF